MNNRKIKFRVWDKKSKTFLVKDGGCFKSNDFIYSLGSIIDGDFSNLEIQQYTGLKDKNGKEIYEGDIININSQTEQDINSDYVVVYDTGSFTLKPIGKNKVDWHLMAGARNNQNEIIGNIYENPDFTK